MTNDTKIRMTFAGNKAKEIADAIGNSMLKCCYEVVFLNSVKELNISDEYGLLTIFDDINVIDIKEMKYKKAVIVSEKDEQIKTGACQLYIRHVSIIDTVKLIKVIAEKMWAEQRMLDLESNIGNLPLTMGRDSSVGKMFLAVIHDLKNSLAVISGHAQTMEDSPAVESGHDPDLIFSIKTIEKHIGRILNTLGVLSVTGRKKDLEKTNVSVASIMENLNLLFSSSARKTESELTIAINNETPSYIITDSNILLRAVAEVLFNSFENIEVNNAGKIRVSVYPEPGDKISIEIKDNGQGLNEESGSRLFENFFTQSEGSAGMGLPCARVLISQLGGTIVAKNADDRGAVVTITIPVGE